MPDDPDSEDDYPAAPARRPRGRPVSPWKARQRDQVDSALDVILGRLAGGPEAAAALLSELAGHAALGNLFEFCQQAWSVVEPATTPTWNWHHELTCWVLQALAESWLKSRKSRVWLPPVLNVVFNMPPGSGKSRILSVLFLAWFWLRAPAAKFIALSVNEDAAMRDARLMRDLVKSDWYQRAFKPQWGIKADQDAVSNFGNTEGGERVSKPSGSEVVGQRSDLLLGDDLNNPNESANRTERDAVNQLWDANQYNRVNDPMRSMRVCVQQRTNHDDHTGHVIAKQGLWAPDNRSGWLHVVLPAEFDPTRRFVMPDALVDVLRGAGVPEDVLSRAVLSDPRTEPGETIDRVRMPTEYLASERRRWLGTSNYANQMLQLPQLEGGGQIQKKWLNWCRLELGGGEEPDAAAPANGLRPSGCRQAAECPPHVIKSASTRYGYDLDFVCISLDAANQKTDRGSQWGILVGAGKGGRRFVLDDRTRRGDIIEVLDVLREIARRWKPDCLLIEKKAAGDSVRTMLEKEIADGVRDFARVKIDVVDPGTQGKEQRLDPCKPAIANGTVHWLDGAPWLEEHVDELAQFPNGANDRVDALSQFLNRYADHEDGGGTWFDET